MAENVVAILLDEGAVEGVFFFCLGEASGVVDCVKCVMVFAGTVGVDVLAISVIIVNGLLTKGICFYTRPAAAVMVCDEGVAKLVVCIIDVLLGDLATGRVVIKSFLRSFSWAEGKS